MELVDLLADVDVDTLPDAQVRDLLEALEAAARAEKFGKFHAFFPAMADCSSVDERGLRFTPGPGTIRYYAREYYSKHLEFFRVGGMWTERLFIAANRVGKTIAGSFEGTAHLTGDYPSWWEGRVFTRAIRMWAAGDYNETTRDVIQKEMLGGIEWHGDKKGVDGTGMIPRDLIDQSSITWKAGVPDLIDTVKIKHKLGDFSTLGFKSYQQGRRSFQGTAQDVIWTDEEPPEDVYNEMLIRLMTTGGLAMLTFTPLNGHTKVVESFMGARH